MKLALILNIINPTLSGVLIHGEKGTAKFTAVRALADILPEIEVIKECPFQLSPDGEYEAYVECMHSAYNKEISEGEPVETLKRKVRVIQLPVGAT